MMARFMTRSNMRRRQLICGRRGMLLVVVLVIITTLALIGTSFSFWMNADLAALKAMSDRQQARLTAESGLDRAILLLRDQRVDMDNWYNNPDVFRRILVWAPDRIGGSENLADQEKVEGRQAWRFSVVGYEVDGDDAKVRYGLTDEAGKLNLNTATTEQLLALFSQIETDDISAEQLVATFNDWRDADNDLSSQLGAESSYYMTLEPAYKAKNGPLDTVEELLMIKWFNGLILYGEDYNRNGYLDDNEDDGPEGLFPPDDGDGILDRGLYSYLTVYSWDMNSGNDNKIRLNVNTYPFNDPEKLPEHITEELSTETIEFIAEARKRGYKFKSVGELVGLEVFEDGSSNYDAMWKEFESARGKANKLGDEAAEEELSEDQEEDDESERESDDTNDDDKVGVYNPETGETKEMTEEELDRLRKEEGLDEEEEDSGASSKSRRRRSREINEDSDEAEENEDNNSRGRSRRSRRSSSSSGDDKETGDKGKDPGTPVVSPVTEADLAVCMNRLTVSNEAVLPGLINVNTASLAVLRTIPGITEEEAQSIAGKRTQVSGEEKMTSAWLVSAGVLEPQKFAAVSNFVTTRSIQYAVDVIGFADHIGTFRRVQAVVEMRGQLAQLRYYRDISALGVGYPVWDDQRSEGFSFEAR